MPHPFNAKQEPEEFDEPEEICHFCFVTKDLLHESIEIDDGVFIYVPICPKCLKWWNE